MSKFNSYPEEDSLIVKTFKETKRFGQELGKAFVNTSRRLEAHNKVMESSLKEMELSLAEHLVKIKRTEETTVDLVFTYLSSFEEDIRRKVFRRLLSDSNIKNEITEELTRINLINKYKNR